MQETFSHSPRLRREHFKYTSLRLLLWALIGIPFWVFGILMVLRGDGYVGVGFAIAFTAIKTGFEIFFYLASREYLRIARHRIVRDESRLTQEVSDGTPVAAIDLDRPFTVTADFNPVGQAIYTVTQDSAALKFSARLDGAERLVSEVLGRPDKWPPKTSDPESAATRYHRQANPDEPSKD